MQGLHSTRHLHHPTQELAIRVTTLTVADNYGKCAHLMPLYYAILYNALQGAVPELSFLAKPRQPNGHNNQIVLVDLFEGDKLDAPTTHGFP